MNINLIAAIGKNNELGINGDLIWKLPSDMKFFKNITMGHPIVMGRKTFESLPKVLPGRKNIVISRNTDILNKEIELYKSIKEFLLVYSNYNEEIFVIGGASIYQQFIDIATKMYLTEIDEVEPNAVVFFPRFEKDEWNCEKLSELEEQNIKYRHVLYKRKV